MKRILLSIVFINLLFAQNYEIDNIRSVGHIPFSYTNDIWGYTAPDGHEFALVGRYDGTSIVDISTNPHEPVEVGFIPGESSTWRDLKVHGTYCYVTNETGGGLDIIDLSDPFNPVKVNAFTTTFSSAHNIYIADGYAYIFGANVDAGGCRILDLATDPENPVEVGFWEDAYFHDGYVKNDTLYGCGIYFGSLFIVDVTDKTNPVTMVEHNYSTYGSHAVWVSGDSKYAITADEKSGGYINIFDIQDFSNINHLSTWYPNEPLAQNKSVHNVFWLDDLLYISYYVYGTRIVDMSDPSNPVEVGFYDFYEGQSGLYNGNWGTYPYTENGLIYSTDMSGNGFFVMSYPFMGEIYFDPIADTEDSSSPIELEIDIDESSNYPVDESTIRLYWGMNGTISDSADVSPGSSSDYVGNLSPTGENGIMHYYVGFSSSNGERVTKPYGAPVSLYSFNIGADQIPPEVESISSLEDQFYPNGEFSVYVEASDNIGVNSVVLKWQVDNEDIQSAECTQIGNTGEFEGVLSYVGVDPGSTIQYWVLVTDASSAENQTESEVKEFSITDDYVLGDFENIDNLDRWELGTWGRQYINTLMQYSLNDSPGSTYEPNSENPCYLIEPLDLTHFEHAYFTFWSGEMFEEGDFGYLQVKRGEDGLWMTILTVNGFNVMEELYADLDNYLNEDELYIRLLFTSDNSEESQGWFVDDIHLVLNEEMPNVSVEDELILPSKVELYSAYPNPFNPVTSIRYSLSQSSDLSLKIYDLMGREINTLVSGVQNSGMHSVKWDARDQNGRMVSSGVYLYRLEAAGQVLTDKMILLK